ncbi:MAG TPA: Uma2 family endonuclease [Pyrinomonadaceae bacterium]|nr:Uma2 family endonuclease [Pyrinomonadaceae bacterium]
MATQLNTFVSPEEYLAAERESDTKSEYMDGVVYAMTGARINHVRIATNLTVELFTQLRGRRCDVLASEMKVRLQDSRKFFYPDVTVLCSEPQFHDERKDIILNPLLVIEILSPSTEAFDRGAKFQAYQTLDSLKEYLLVAQDKPVVEQFVRQSDGKWTYTAVIGLESSLHLPSVECTLNLSAVYDKVDFDS